MISRAEFDSLMRHRAKISATITMTTDPPGQPVRRDAVRLDGLVDECERRFAALGIARTAVRGMLEPARALAGGAGFSTDGRRGLALFLAPGLFRRFDLPRPVEDLATVGERFRIAPLLPFVGEPSTAFFLLAVTTARAALFSVDGQGMKVLDANLPQGARTAAGNTGDLGQGATPEERKAQLLQQLNVLAAAVKTKVGHLRQPVLLAALPEIAGNFRKQSELTNLWPQHLDVDPDSLDAAELRQRAWDMLAGEIEDDAWDSIDHFNSLFHDSSPRARTRPAEIVRAARWGRLDTLILGRGNHVWGRFDEQADRVETHPEPQAGDDDLLDFAACQTLLNGGEVKVVDRDQVPGGGWVAAILRY